MNCSPIEVTVTIVVSFSGSITQLVFSCKITLNVLLPPVNSCSVPRVKLKVFCPLLKAPILGSVLSINSKSLDRAVPRVV